LAFESALIEPVSSDGADLNAAKEEAGTLMLQAISSTDISIKSAALQSMFDYDATHPNKT
jgi:hypothetical protein